MGLNMLAIGVIEKLLLMNPVAFVGLFVAIIAWFRGFKWWVLLPVLVSFFNFFFLPTIAFLALVCMAVCGSSIGEKNTDKIKVHCPQCRCSLKGVTREMIGDTGVCLKCNTEFVIREQ